MAAALDLQKHIAALHANLDVPTLGECLNGSNQNQQTDRNISEIHNAIGPTAHTYDTLDGGEATPPSQREHVSAGSRRRGDGLGFEVLHHLAKRH
jgi:hypothetical protein